MKKNLRLKRVLLLTLVVLLLGVTGITKVKAESFTVNGLRYTITNTTQYYVSVSRESASLSGAITIPYSVMYNNKSYRVTAINDFGFQSCSGITSISMSSSILTIGALAFTGCSVLTEINIGTNVTSIGSEAFSGCTSLNSITIPKNVTSLGYADNLFYGSGVGQIIVDSENTKYDSRNNCNAIIETSTNTLRCGCKNTVIPNTVTTIANAAFDHCSGLTSITIPNSVTKIEDCAFNYCSGLTSIDIPNSVTYVGGCAFYSCSNLSSISLGNSVSSIGAYAFLNTKWYKNQSNGLLYLDGWCLGYKGDKPTNTLTIEEGTRGIAGMAFPTCNGLTNVVLPNSLLYIDYSSFESCSALTSLIIPNSVTTIHHGAFLDCTALASVVIGSSVNLIESNVFTDCGNLTSVYMLASTVPTLDRLVFNYTHEDLIIYVPYASLNAYKTASNWSDYASRIQPMVYTTISGYGNSTASDKWAFIASPVTSNVDPTTIDGLIAETASEFDLYRLNPNAANEWENWKQTGDHYHFDMINGRGYLYANKNDVNFIVKGDMFTGNYKNVNIQEGWNLVGNPYGQDAYINRSYYKMNAAGDDIEAVSAYTTTAIPVCTGVVVQGASNSDVVRFTKTAPSKSTDNGGLQMTLTKASARGIEMQDKAIVSFDENTLLGKFIFNEDNAKLYVPQNGEDYAIAYSNGQDDMLLYFKTKETGTYTINFDNNTELKDAYLVDKFEGAIVDLSVCSSYIFIGSAADRPDRFVIRFENPENSVENSMFAYQHGNEIIVNGEGELQIFDVMGRLIEKQNINGIETIEKPSQNGVYIMKLNDKTQKIIVH